MIVRCSSFLLFVFAVSTIADYTLHSSPKPRSNLGEATSGVHRSNCSNALDTVGIALVQLSSGDYDQIQSARNALLNVAHQSNACRAEVIRSLIGAMDKPNLDFESQPSSYYLWREGSKLLGELRAIEALDLLISHLDETNGFHSASMVFQPAIIGVCEMGKEAIPKLTLALKKNSKPKIRMAAAYCLTEIGGEKPMHALLQAQKNESSQCVANFIKVSLNTFRYKTKNGFAFDNEAPQANAEARRNWLISFECVE